jgi:hypothetical protein
MIIGERVSGLAIRPRLSYREMLAKGGALGFSAVFGLLLFLGAAGLVRPLYPAAALVLGVVLYTVHRGQYVSFVIWLYMITPFVRRVVDYQAGFQEVSIVTLAPQLAATVSLFCIFKKLPLLYSMSFLPFLLVLVGVLYACFIGMVNSGPVAVAYDLLLWAVPIAFGFAIASDWRSFPMYRDAIFKVFLWGGAILGAYGIHQYFYLFPWDAYWMRNADITSVGYPFPLLVRVYSTMNSPTPFGAMMIPTLLIVFVANSWLRFPAALLGFIAFALSIVRTAWLGWLIAVVFLITILRGGRRVTLVLGIAAVALIAIPIITTGDIGERFTKRLDSLQDLEGDKSFQERSALYGSLTQQALTTFWGIGTGAVGKAAMLTSQQKVVNVDSGFLTVPYVLGWPGAFLMLIGVCWLLLRPPGIVDRRNEIAVQTSTAICVAYIAMMTSYNSMYGVGGIVFWTFMALRLSGRLWSANTQIVWRPPHSHYPEPRDISSCGSPGPVSSFAGRANPLTRPSLDRFSEKE